MISKGGKEELNLDYAIWLNNDGLLTSWLLGTMNEEALSLVVGCDSAFQIWKCLKEHYLASTKEQELHLKGQLAIKRGDDESLEDFIRKFKRTCDNLAAIRKPVDDLDKVFQLSRVVGGRYQPYNLAVLSKPPYPTFNQYIARLQNNERDLQVAEQESKDKVPNYVQAFVAQRGRGQRGRSNGSRNPMINNNPIPQQAIPQNFQPKNSTQQGENQCQICGVAGHTALKCWYRFDHAYQSEELPQALATLSLVEDKDQNTYVDTRAIDHMTLDTGKLYTKRPYRGKQKVLTGDGTPLQISHIGSTSIGSLKLKDVLVVPNVKKNLLSVSKFTDDNSCIFEFSSNGFVIKDQATQAVLARGTRKGQLYALDEEEKHVLAVISNKATDSIWHQRLGHPNSSVLKTLASKNSIIVSNWTKPSYLCSSCQMGKSYDYSRFTWFNPLHRKSDFRSVFLKFQKIVANQFHKSIKIFQCDGGGEFSNSAFIKHLEDCGIKQQVSCPGTPEQNGVAGRKQRHIVEIDGELCKYHDSDEWLQASTNLQPSRHLDEKLLTFLTPSHRTITSNEEENNHNSNNLKGNVEETIKGAPNPCREETNVTSSQILTREDSTQLNNTQEDSKSSQSFEGSNSKESSSTQEESGSPQLSEVFNSASLEATDGHQHLEEPVTTFDGGIFLSQGQYANDLLSQTSMLEASTIATSLAIKENPASRDTELVDAKEYRKIVGALQYLTITRIDICYAVNKVFAMPIVSAIQLKEKAHQDTAFFLEKIVYHGPPKSNQLYHDQLLKQSTVH
ncbi:hypothetical protein SLEP1_g37295 [Rubroshorea leprosula]|uniref:Integrase catalytic domain-containing protein n=1 Tax=Rubroshorea leprosula TaxID=152421 RepID=A0AAV5KUK6_9ROSI|nr:hypothetical protein SLEP1_g37295 [Rubroshorea leprosula]